VIYNNIAYLNEWGIATNNASNNLIQNNTIYSNNLGIHLDWSSNDNNILSNNITSCNQGIALRNTATNNQIANNTISNNNHGIYVEFSHNNLFHHNSLINNANQAYDDGVNSWDNGYPSGGNYWSDYTGSDYYDGTNQDILGSDGIGDAPYYIQGGTGAKDEYPLMSPYTLKPMVSIYTDKYSYSPSDIMITTIYFENPLDRSVDTYFLWYFGLPDYGYWIRIWAIQFPLPAGFDESYDIPLHIGDWGPHSFNARFFVALLNTTTYEIIDWDTANWRYVPGKKLQEETMPSEIAEEITGAIERVELPSEMVQAQGETLPEEIAKEIMKIVKE